MNLNFPEIKSFALMIDLDGSLKTESWDKNYEDKIKVHEKVYRFKIRPHIKEFLTIMGRLGDIYINTKATSRYCSKFIKFMDISNLITGYISRDELVLKNRYRKIILIDNDHEIALEKIHFLKKHADKVETILIPTYRGNDSDKELLKLISEIRVKAG